MSYGDPVLDPPACGDAPAYVLGALESAEADRFRRHVDECVVCRDEVLTLQAVADALPMSAPQVRAPKRLAHRTLSRVRAEPRGTSRRRSRILRLATMPTCAIVAVAVALGALDLAGATHQVTRSVAAAVIDQGRHAGARLRVNGNSGAELIVSHMPAPPRGSVYEVWLQHPGQPPAPTRALFTPASSGAGRVHLSGDLSGVSEVLVTPEPLGGSRVPTHAPVILAALSS